MIEVEEGTSCTITMYSATLAVLRKADFGLEEFHEILAATDSHRCNFRFAVRCVGD
jgi:hypothetical protein